MDRLSAAAERFLRDAVGSMLHLDVLLLLCDRDAAWSSADDIARQLRIAPTAVGGVLEDLAAENLLDVKIAGAVLYKFAPLGDGVAAIIQEVSQLHYRNRDAVAAAVGPWRGSRAARSFADAFRLKREDPDA